MKIAGRMMVVSMVAMGLLGAGAQAGLIYSNDFNDLTDVTVSADPGGQALISADRAVDSGGKSLKFIDAGVQGAAYARVTPTIAEGPLSDTTYTLVFSFYSVGNDNDHASLRLGQNSGFTTCRGYPAGGYLGVGNSGWNGTGFSWPAGEWVTFAYSMDFTNNQATIYAHPGTSVSLGDLVGSYTIDYPSSEFFRFWCGWDSAVQDLYLDNLKIYSELNEVPEPTTCLLLLAGGIAGWIKRR